MSQRDSRLIGGVYMVGQVITSGGMLSTYTAYNRNTNDVVGLQVVEFPPDFDVYTVQQQLQPLERRRSIQSPYVIRVHDWGIDGNRIYIATDPPRGMTLQHVLDNENVSIERALDIARQLAQGVKILHENGSVGIDMRPPLITVDAVNVTDRVQLDDVGLRTLLKSLGYIARQQTGDIGYLDPLYASPELINGGMVDARSDVYQLGLLLFALITGRLPFVGRNAAETGILQNTAPVPRMQQFKHDTPPLLQNVVERALAKNPFERYPDAASFLTALENIPLQHPQISGEWQRLTREISSVEGDVTLSATLIKGQEAADDDDKTMRAVPEGVKIYANLCFEKEGQEVQRLAILQKSVIIGRTDPKRGIRPDIDLTIFDPNMTVSRQHARIRYEETFFYIEDLKSVNKTKLGELILTPMEPELLQHGDKLKFGSVSMVFRVPGMPDRPVIKESKT
ncbi:MAG TPA: FHA domain-containing serine/threonine-protein kinase [Ktedonobacteraceae bacterium]|nr:FHA domain-containing serine/threonine-protein kinase [Ktedonobacteraceae bacterium]